MSTVREPFTHNTWNPTIDLDNMSGKPTVQQAQYVRFGPMIMFNIHWSNGDAGSGLGDLAVVKANQRTLINFTLPFHQDEKGRITGGSARIIFPADGNVDPPLPERFALGAISNTTDGNTTNALLSFQAPNSNERLKLIAASGWYIAQLPIGPV